MCRDKCLHRLSTETTNGDAGGAGEVRGFFGHEDGDSVDSHRSDDVCIVNASACKAVRASELAKRRGYTPRLVEEKGNEVELRDVVQGVEAHIPSPFWSASRAATTRYARNTCPLTAMRVLLAADSSNRCDAVA